jgi:hypothetical protein
MRQTKRAMIGKGAPASARKRTHGRRGIAALIAMLYLIIFSTLALGFYAAVTTAAQVAHNDEKALGAQIATESGLAFITYQLGRVGVPGNTPPNKVMEEVLKDLVAQQGKSDNLSGRPIDLVGNTIYFPAGTNEFVPLDGQGAGFRAEIADAGDGFLKVKVQGRYRGTTITRAVEMYFQSVDQSTRIFDFGIVTKGRIVMTGGGSIKSPAGPADANVLSLSKSSTPLTMSGEASIAGDVFMTNPDGSSSISGSGSVGGSAIPSVRAEHIHAGDPNPEPSLPAVDTSMFLPFVTSTYKPGKKVYTNVLVPPNTNPNFSSDTTIEGVLYIKNPNKVAFTGHATIRGVIVVENGAAPGSNSIKFSGGATAYGMETLPPSPQFPPELRALRGSALLAPGYAVTLSGQSGSIGGTLVADSFTLSGGSGGVIEGTLLALGGADLVLTGGASISRVRATGPIPAGLILDKSYKPVPESYLEVRP